MCRARSYGRKGVGIRGDPGAFVENEPGMTAKRLQRLMGHSRITTTLDIYAKFLRDEEPPEETLNDLVTKKLQKRAGKPAPKKGLKKRCFCW